MGTCKGTTFNIRNLYTYSMQTHMHMHTCKHTHRAPHLQVVRKLLPSCIARVHCDEDSARGVQHDLCPLKHKLLQLHNHSLLDAEHLLRYHGQHLQLNAVELVKAGPRTGLGQPLEELAHGLVVQAIGAVEHNTLWTGGRGEGMRRESTTGS